MGSVRRTTEGGGGLRTRVGAEGCVLTDGGCGGVRGGGTQQSVARHGRRVDAMQTLGIVGWGGGFERPGAFKDKRTNTNVLLETQTKQVVSSPPGMTTRMRWNV